MFLELTSCRRKYVIYIALCYTRSHKKTLSLIHREIAFTTFSHRKKKKKIGMTGNDDDFAKSLASRNSYFLVISESLLKFLKA